MARIEVKTVWANPAEWIDCLVEFCDVVPYKTKAGKEITAWLFLADGEYLTFPERIANLRELLKTVGSDTDQWKGKRFIMKALPAAKKFRLEFQPSFS